ncbi:hypothetical protein [Mesorhizobium sp.]|uniref:hypothetical protein n=1 Tax=Mesorhizobium sp. TaxID=1871066 RepID=UPI00257D8093|nr:hypothetical protein [Mesorhizobium sp.]
MPDKRNNGGERVIRDMSFKMSNEFHYEFKLAAHNAGITMKELLERSFDTWKRLNTR